MLVPAWGTAKGPDPSSKATLWVKAQHEGALPPPCIVRKDPRVPHTPSPSAGDLSFRGPGLLGDLESSWKGPNGVQLWTQRKHLLRITLTGWTPALPGFLWALWVPVVCCIDLAFSGFIAILNM